MQDQTHINESIREGAEGTESWLVSSDAHDDTQALLAPSSAHCLACLALSVAGLVPLLGTALGAHHWDIAQPSSPGNPCW